MPIAARAVPISGYVHKQVNPKKPTVAEIPPRIALTVAVVLDFILML